MANLAGHRALRLLAALLMMLLPACYNWHTVEIGPGRYVSEVQPPIVRLTLTDGQSIDIEDPEIVGGAIVGPAGPRGRGRLMADTAAVTVPLESVTTLQARELSPVRTGVVVAVVAVGSVAALVSIFSNTTHGVGCSPTGC